MESIWSLEKIKEVLPHRYPFLFIDKVLDINKEEKKVTCLKRFTINEYFFQGHFPDNPVVPGVIIVEAMAQAAIVLYASLRPEMAAKKKDYYLGNVEAKFMKAVKPGEELILSVKAKKIISTAGIIEAEASVEGNMAAKARIAFGVVLDEK